MLLLEGQLLLAKDRGKTRRPRGRSAYATILSTRPRHPRATSRKQPWDCSRFFSSRARGRCERSGVACLRTGRTTRARGNPAFLDAARTSRRNARQPRRSLAPLPRDRSPRLASAALGGGGDVAGSHANRFEPPSTSVCVLAPMTSGHAAHSSTFCCGRKTPGVMRSRSLASRRERTSPGRSGCTGARPPSNAPISRPPRTPTVTRSTSTRGSRKTSLASGVSRKN